MSEVQSPRTPRQGYSRRRSIPAIAAPLAISLLMTTWAGLIAGRGLAVYLAAPLLASLYIPFLTVADSRPCYAGGVELYKRFAACALGIAVALLAFDFGADVTIGEWFRCVVVISSLVVAIAAIANLLARIFPSSLAATFTSIIALLWMTWPVWMSHALTQTRVDWLVWPHPLLAINGVLEHLGAWDHAPIAYRQLTILNQDIPFRLPTSILPATLVHFAIGALLLVRQSRKTVARTNETSIAA